MSRHLLAAEAICSFSTIENVRYHGNVDLLTQTFSISYLREGGEDGTESPPVPSRTGNVLHSRPFMFRSCKSNDLVCGDTYTRRKLHNCNLTCINTVVSGSESHNLWHKEQCPDT